MLFCEIIYVQQEREHHGLAGSGRPAQLSQAAFLFSGGKLI